MRTLYLLDSPAARATRDASPVALPGVTGAPRLAARVRLARGTDAPDMGPSQDVIDALAMLRDALACGECERMIGDAYSIIDECDTPMSGALVSIGTVQP